MAISDLKLAAPLVAHECADAKALAEAQAKAVAERLAAAISARGHATLVVSGGKSPVAFFQQLARQPLAWAQVTVTLADERWVPVEHADSNEGLVKRHLLVGEAAKARFMGLYRVAATVEQAALEADQALADLPAIDVLVLGMGDDGHTASLFPASPNLEQALSTATDRRCLAMLAPTVPRQRLTMTLPLLSSAGFTVLALQGSSKLDTLRTALGGDVLGEMPIRAFLKKPLQIYWCP